jgi:hypothetical protein
MFRLLHDPEPRVVSTGEGWRFAHEDEGSAAGVRELDWRAFQELCGGELDMSFLCVGLGLLTWLGVHDCGQHFRRDWNGL